MVTLSFLTSCSWLTRLQIYTQQPVELSLIIGLVGSSSGVTLQMGLPSPSRISQVYLALTPRVNMEACVLMLMQPTGKRLCSEWQLGLMWMTPVATKMSEGLILMGNLMLPSLSRLSSNLAFFLLSSKVLLYFFFLSCTFSLMTLQISHIHSSRDSSFCSEIFRLLMVVMPDLLTWLRRVWSLTLPSMQAGWSLVSPSFFSSSSFRKIFRFQGSISRIDLRTNYSRLMFLLNLAAISQEILKVPVPWTSSFSFSSEMISWQFHLNLDTIFSTWAGVLLKSLIWNLTLSLSSPQLDLLSWPMGTPYSLTIVNNTFFSVSVQLFSSSSLSASSSKSISPWFCCILTMVLMSFLSLRVRLSATGKSWQVWALSSSRKQYSLALRIETQLAQPYLYTPRSRSMSFFLAHQTAGLCPKSSPRGMKFSSPSQLIFLRSGWFMFLRASSRYLQIRFLTLWSNCRRLVYCTERWGSIMCWSHSLRLGWYSLYSNWFYSISFCRKILRLVSSQGRDNPKALRKLLAYALISPKGLFSSLPPILKDDLWICFHLPQPYCRSNFFSCQWSSVDHLLPLVMGALVVLTAVLPVVQVCFWVLGAIRSWFWEGRQMQYTSGSPSDRMVSRVIVASLTSEFSSFIELSNSLMYFSTALV